MTTDLIAAGQYALEQSGTYPAFGYTRDGALFMFSVHDGQLVARPYLPVPGTGLSDPPKPDPVGAPIFTTVTDYLKDQAARSLDLPGVVLRGASREFEREVASVGSGEGPSPTGISIKSIETPGYLQAPPPTTTHPVVTHPASPATAPVAAPVLDPQRLAVAPLPPHTIAPHVYPTVAPLSPPVVTHPASPATAPVAAPVLDPQRLSTVSSIENHERWQREHWRRNQAVAQGDYSPIPQSYPSDDQQSSFYLYRLDPVTGWTPVAPAWLSYEAVQSAMTDPNATYGAYDQSMVWTPMTLS